MSSFLTLTALDPHLRANWLALHLGLEFLTLYFEVSLLTDRFFWGFFFFFFFPLFWSCWSSCLCGFHAKIDKGVPQNTLMQIKNVEDKIASLTTYSWTHTHTEPYIYIYIYIYTHTLMLIIMPHSSLPYPCHLFKINYVTKKIYNAEITVYMQCVTLSKRGSHRSFNKITFKGGCSTVINKINSIVLEWHVPPFLQINHREGFWLLPTISQLAFHISFYMSGVLLSLWLAKSFNKT